jgi:hypothetical protein
VRRGCGRAGSTRRAVHPRRVSRRLRSPARSRQGPARGRPQAHEARILPAATLRPRIRMTKVKRPARQPAIRRPRALVRLLARHRGPPALEPRARRVPPPISTRACARAPPAARSRSPLRASWVLPWSWCSWRDRVHRAVRPRWLERRHPPGRPPRPLRAHRPLRGHRVRRPGPRGRRPLPLRQVLPPAARAPVARRQAEGRRAAAPGHRMRRPLRPRRRRARRRLRRGPPRLRAPTG